MTHQPGKLRLSKTQELHVRELWQWFAVHQDELLAVTGHSDGVLDGFLAQLRKIDSRVHFEICVNKLPRELILTAGGNREAFSLVDALAACAPRIDDWLILALKPAAGLPERTEYEAAVVYPPQLWFLPLESVSRPAELGIRIGIPGFAGDPHSHCLNAAHHIIDSVLGERLAALEVAHLEVGALPEDPESDGYLPLTDLAEFVTWRVAKRS